MKNFAYTIALAFVCSSLLSGCNGDSDVYEPPATFTLQGKPDPKFVGNWVATAGNSKYDIKADGMYNFKGVAVTRQGTFNSDYNAKWSVDGDKIYFEDQSKNVACYIFTLDKDKLELRGASGSKKLVSTLMRKS